MKKRYIIGLVVCVVIIFCSTGFYFVKANLNTTKTTKIEVYNIVPTEKVFINGVIVPEETEDIYFDAIKGNISKVIIKDGQTVKKGDALFTYKNDQVTEQIQQNNLQLESSKKQKKELLAQQENLKSQPVVAGENLHSSNVSTSSIDDQIKLYEEQIKSLKQKEYFTVVAPIEGKVILHDPAKAGTTPYITIENTKFYIKGTVNEKDQPKLKVDQVAETTILSTSNVIKGRIVSVGNRPVPETISASNVASAGSSNISYYEVKINLDSQDNLTNGFHVQSIVKLSGEFVKIPKSAILQDGETHYVYKVINKKLTKQVVTYSDGDSDKVAVTRGLREGEEIVENPTSDMKEGMTIE